VKIDPADWKIWAAAAGALTVAGAVVAFQCLKRPVDPEETERQRRSHLNRVGRIVEGHVVELVESTSTPPPPRSFGRHTLPLSDPQRKLVCYSYSISGVSYETAQDVTTLQEIAGLHQLAAGQSASVKYDPANPSNSIVIADNWSGLR
jgi:hypothetical protein